MAAKGQPRAGVGRVLALALTHSSIRLLLAIFAAVGKHGYRYVSEIQPAVSKVRQEQSTAHDSPTSTTSSSAGCRTRRHQLTLPSHSLVASIPMLS